MTSSDNIARRDLQKIILGERTEPLSDMEIRNLFSYPTTPEFILYLITALNCKKIDPNTTLLQAIANATKRIDMLPVALALRYGADPNLYVDAPNIGDIHILGYSYLALSDRDLPILNSTIIMLMAKGSNPSMLIFDSKGGVIRDEFSLVEPVKGTSVIDWLEDQGFDTIIPTIQNNNYDSVNEEFLTMLGTFLDEIDVLKQEPDIKDIIGSHSVNVFDKYYKCIDNDIGIKTSIEYLNLETFEKFIDRGAFLRYDQINQLILLMGEYKKMGDIISMCQIREFLFYALSRGAILDTHQINLITTIVPNLICRVMEIYNQPYWRKICKTKNGIVSDKLKYIAYTLNLYPEFSRDTLCNQIKGIAQADPKKVKTSAIERQKTRIMSDVSYINEFTEEQHPDILCRNRSLVDNIYDYPDADIAYYRDDQETLWCFLSPTFEKITNERTNPYTNDKFPSYFLDMVERKQAFINKYRLGNIITISEAVDKLNFPDEINNMFTDKYIKLFKESMTLAGSSEWNIEKLTKEDLEKILYDNFVIEVNLKDLSLEDAITTFYVVSYFELIKIPETNDNFFEQIEEMSSNKISK